MSVRCRVRHTTRYEYAYPVASGRHLAHLTPRTTAWQQLEHHELVIQPSATEVDEGADYFGNPVRRWAIGLPHSEFEVRAESVVSLRSQLKDWADTPAWETSVLTEYRSRTEAAEVTEFTLPSPFVPLMPAAAAYARPSFSAGRPLRDALLELSRRMRADFTFDAEATTIATPIAEVLKRRRGVCQDFAHCLLSALRTLGLAARYMSGYVLDDAVEARGGGASHAWVAVYCPGNGWIGCDPTNGKLADLEFVTLGWGRDFGDVTPLRGIVLGHGDQELSVSVEFSRL